MTGETVAIALAAALLGLLGGLAIAVARRPQGRAPSITAQLAVQTAELRRIADQGSQRDLSAEQLRAGLDGARRTLDELRAHDRDRRIADAEHREVVRRLATVLAGGASKGRPGELLLRDHLAELPPSLLVSDFRVGGRVVEYGLVLPDGRRLPIDSKWAAVAELEALESARDAVTRDACVRAVERAVAVRVKEVARYVDPTVTAPVAVAAVPDAVYGVLGRAHADAFANGVLIVPYSSALPIVLFLFTLVQRFGDVADVQAVLVELAAALEVMGSVVENKVVRAGTMLTNAADELRSQLGKARGGLARAHASGSPSHDDGPSLQLLDRAIERSR
ncbi:MAG TPA: DNA recombination protein RmuC [Actinomycetota bacterium]